MYIQIDNVGFINKGAELMLCAVRDQLKNKDKYIVKGPNVIGEFDRETNFGFFYIANLGRFRINFTNLFRQNSLHQLRLVKKNKIDLLLDAGGFQFGDQWNNTYSSKSNERLLGYYTTYKNNKTKIIFLPQAYGPFKEELSKDRIKKIFSVADILYARDKVSYAHLVGLFGENKKIKLAPDFTLLVKPDINYSLKQKTSNTVGIIPNSKMITHTTDTISSAYLDFLNKVIVFLLKKNQKIVLLNHEGKKDWRLIEKIASNFSDNKNITALNNLDAYQVKAVIGNVKLLISSRFHGVVSGLNQSVPTFSTSWSHKYEELLKDYSVINNKLEVNDINESLRKLDEALIYPDKFIVKAEIIEKMKRKIERMWNDITIFYK